MSDLTVTAADVAVVSGPGDGFHEQATGPADEAITAGQAVRYNTSTGYFTPAKGSSAAEARCAGIAANGATLAGMTITVIRKGIVNLGDALGDLDYDQTVYLGATDGVLADATATVSVTLGQVVPGFSHTTPDKLLRVNVENS